MGGSALGLADAMAARVPRRVAELNPGSPVGTVGLLIRLADAATDRLVQLHGRRRLGMPLLSPSECGGAHPRLAFLRYPRGAPLAVHAP